jgi:hypothetical protein
MIGSLISCPATGSGSRDGKRRTEDDMELLILAGIILLVGWSAYGWYCIIRDSQWLD